MSLDGKLKIFVVTHKPGEVPCDEVFQPIHVGHAISPFGLQMSGMLGDDTGDNISTKNAQYCEMTAHYWIWKNVHDTEYVGVCHYRRFFACDISASNVDELMADADVLLVEPSYYLDSVYSYFAKFMGAENMTILSLVMRKLCPDYFETLQRVCDGINFHPFNMLFCRKSLFDDYCQWMFTILCECEQYIKPSPYTNARRVLAYMAEMLTGVFFTHRKMQIKTVPYYILEDGRKVQKTYSVADLQHFALYESLLYGELADKVMADRKEKFDNPAILLGLKQDNII